MSRLVVAIALSALIVGCASGSAVPRSRSKAHEDRPQGPQARGKTSSVPRPASIPPEALVTAETENSIALVALGHGKEVRVVRRVDLAHDPEFVAVGREAIVVTSPSAGAVTLIDGATLRRIKVLRGFGAPHIAEISADGRYAYVTDDARGQLDVISLRAARVVGHAEVGVDAHHMAVRPGGGRIWIALGESAQTIVIVDSSDPTHPSVVRRFDPGFAVHDLCFAPSGTRVWMTAADDDYVSVLDARTRRLAFTVPGGAPPQHVAFDAHRAYVASGYGSQLEAVDAANGRVIRVVDTPYGSFNLDARGNFVTTTSLSRGVLTVYDRRLRLQRILRVASAARDVALLPQGSRAR
jgi:YVTN family beta-propeller protein